MRRLRSADALLVLLAGCTEYSYTSARGTEVFQQNRLNTVDILMVVDNSCSMVEEQDKLASNFNAFIAAFEGVDVDWQIGVVTTDTLQDEFSGRLVGGDDEIVLLNASGGTIDRVAWDASWPIEEGVALQLDPEAELDSDNSSADAWCVATERSDSGDLGTPGAENTSCTGAGRPASPAHGAHASLEASAPSAGDVVITEFLANPSVVDDALGEWVELANVTDTDLDLSGCELVDDGRNSVVFPEGTVLSAGARLVVGRSADTGLNGGVAVDIESGEDFTLSNAVRYLSPETEDVEAQFAEMVSVGTGGSGIEMGLEGAKLALSEPLLSEDNAGFLRDDANLSLVFVSDEEDSSPDKPTDYLRFWSDLKGEASYRDHGILNISAVVGKDEPDYEGLPSCESDNGAATYGSRYVDLTLRTEGALESICDEDFSPIAAELGLLASGLELVFELAGLADPRDLTVSLYAERSDDSFIRELVVDEDYSFDAQQNAIVFDAAHIPPAETFIVVDYRILANGSQVTESSE